MIYFPNDFSWRPIENVDTIWAFKYQSFADESEMGFSGSIVVNEITQSKGPVGANVHCWL